MSPTKNISAYQKTMERVALLLPQKFRTFFLHPIGPTTIFFWAPTCKWSLVLAGLGDINRPANAISFSQTASLMLTGAIWSRYSMVIVPKNWNLFSVNIFIFMMNAYNVVRILTYQKEQDVPPKK